MRTILLPVLLLQSLALAQLPPSRLFDAPIVRTDLADEVDCFADADGDGDVDLATFAFGAPTAYRTAMAVLWNDGSGGLSLGPITTLPAASGIYVVYADVTGDGLADLVANATSLTAPGTGLWLFRGTGGGVLAAPVHMPLPGEVLRLALGDANADGVRDVFALYQSPGVPLDMGWFASSPGGLAPVTTAPVSTSSIGEIAVLDLDGDNRSDLAITEQRASSWVIHLVHTTAAGLVFVRTIPAPISEPQFVPADWDSDSDEDLLCCPPVFSTQPVFTTMFNQGGVLTAGPGQAIRLPAVGRVFAGDLDGDSDLDLVLREAVFGSSSSYSITRVRNDAATFVTVDSRLVPQAPITGGAGLVDLDGDARADFVDARVMWFSGASLESTTREGPVRPIDWDGDGDVDSVGPSVVNRFDGAGAFATLSGAWPAPQGGGGFLDPVNFGDFDGDGALEALAPAFVFVAIGLPPTFSGMHRLRADGDFRLVDQGLCSSSTLPMNLGLTDDLDGDGDLDLLDDQGAWLNSGSGQFSLQPIALQGFRPVAKGDVDGDGDVDFLAVRRQGTSSCAICFRTGPLAFAVVVLTQSGALPNDAQSAILVDLDGDGDLDVACRERTAASGVRTNVFVNTGGVFTSALTLPEEGSVRAGDVDQDGLVDLVVLQGTRAHFLARRPGPLAYASPVTFTFGGAIDLADQDQDGDLDLVGPTTLLGQTVPASAGGLRRQYGTGGLGLGARRPVLSALGPIRTAQPLSMRVTHALGGSFGVMVFSAGSANVPNFLPGLTAYVASIDAEFVLFLGGAPGVGGAGSVDASFRLPPGTAGVTVYSQFVALDAAAPSGLVHSNGVELRIGQ